MFALGDISGVFSTEIKGEIEREGVDEWATECNKKNDKLVSERRAG